MRLQIFMMNFMMPKVVLIYSVLKKDEDYYSQVFLKEYKFIEKEIRVLRYITKDLEISFDDSNEE